MWDVYRRRRELDALKDHAAQLGLGVLRRLDNSPFAKTVGGNAAESAGQVLGAARGVVHDVEGLGDGVVLAAISPIAAHHNMMRPCAQLLERLRMPSTMRELAQRRPADCLMTAASSGDVSIEI